MMPYLMRYDHTNYARWGTIYLEEMHQLPSQVLVEFKRGNFEVKYSAAKFNQSIKTVKIKVRNSSIQKGRLVKFRDPISKTNPLTFATLYEIEKNKASSDKSKILKADRTILYRLVTAYEAGRQVNVQNVLKHELMPVLSLLLK